MEQWTQFLDKRAKVIFEDGTDHFSKKFGLIVEINATHMILKVNSHSEAINLSKILRVEEVSNEDHY